MAFFNFAIGDAFQRFLLGIEADGGSFVVAANGSIHRTDLDDGAFRCKVAVEDRESAHFGIRVVQAVNNRRIQDFMPGDIFGQRFAGNGHAIPEDGPRFLQKLIQYSAHAARPVNVFNEDVGGRSQLGQVRHAVSNFVDAFQRVINFSFLSECQGVKYGIGGAAHRHIQCERVVERFLGYDITRLQIQLDQLHELGCRFADEFLAFFGYGENGAVARQRKAQRLGQTVHGVRGEHPGTGAAGWTAVLFQFKQLIIIDFADLVSAYAFEYGSQGELFPLAVHTRFHRAAADKNRRDIDPQGAHHHARRDFITVGNADHAVEPVGGNNRFQGIGNDLAAWQGITHPDMSHGDPVIDADRIEFKRNAAGFADRFLDDFAEFLQMHVARHDVDIGVADRNERLAEILLFYACCPQKTAVRSAVKTFFDHV
ncbi:hypothetical protein D3C75_697150 [compost metagenome]